MSGQWFSAKTQTFQRFSDAFMQTLRKLAANDGGLCLAAMLVALALLAIICI